MNAETRTVGRQSAFAQAGYLRADDGKPTNANERSREMTVGEQRYMAIVECNIRRIAERICNGNKAESEVSK